MDTVKVIRKKDYAIVEINNGKVNAINEALGRDLIEAWSNPCRSATLL